MLIYPASVQGGQAPAEIRQALLTAARRAEVDVLLLVRGGGAMEDLWAFNDESLARLIVASPMPVISGVGHETDFTIADFCADVRAPTPTAAAELCAEPRAVWLGALGLVFSRLHNAVERQLQVHNQRIDWAAARVSRPSYFVARQHARFDSLAQSLRHSVRTNVRGELLKVQALETLFPKALERTL